MIIQLYEKENAYKATGATMTRQAVFRKLVHVLKGHGARKVAVFGSYARGEEKPGSDIDIVVNFSRRTSLLKLVRIERELSELLGKKVDLLTERSISPYLIKAIKKQMKVLYG